MEHITAIRAAGFLSRDVPCQDAPGDFLRYLFYGKGRGVLGRIVNVLGIPTGEEVAIHIKVPNIPQVAPLFLLSSSEPQISSVRIRLQYGYTILLFELIVTKHVVC